METTKIKSLPTGKHPPTFNQYRRPPEDKFKTFNKLPTLTQQHFKEHTNINDIVGRFIKTGVLEGTRLEPKYGDFSNYKTYHEAQNAIINAQQDFANLSSKIRNRFDNDPGKLLEFVSNEDNYEEAHELGLLHEDIALRSESNPLPEKQEKTAVKAEGTEPVPTGENA